MPLAVGTRLGPYEILTPLGAGGMGEVYRARDTRLDRIVAVKILPPGLAGDPERRARFEREARTVAALTHPHICTLHDIGQHDGTSFLVMEHLAGHTLAERLRKGPLPLAQALTVAIEIAEALAAAHRQGVIHRDLKPGNVMLTGTGAMLLDFGLAKLKPAVAMAGSVTVSAIPGADPVTGAGAILGTVPYMAPEQLEGREADARSDLFAFGAVLYEMLTGRRAFPGDSPVSVIAAILERDPPPLSSLQPLTPPLLDRIVRQCLAKAPGDRPDTAHDVANELRWIREMSDAPSVVREGRRGVRAALLIATGLAGMAAGAAVMSWVLPEGASPPGRSPARAAQFVVELPASDTLAVDLRPAIAFSRDGSQLVYAAVRDGTSRLFLRRLADLEPVLLPGTEGGDGPFFSPDGKHVGFFASGKLMKTAVDGGMPVALAEAPVARGGAWTEHGTILFTSAPGAGFWEVPASGGPVRVVSSLDLEQAERTQRFPDGLPGGRAALITVRTAQHPSFDETAIVTMSLASGERSAPLERGTQPRYLPTDHLLFARAGALHALRFDPRRLVAEGAATVVLENLMTARTTGAAHYTVSDSGALAYIRGPAWLPRRTMVMVDRQNQVQPLLQPDRSYATPRFSPDGRLVVVHTEDATDNIWVVDASSRNSARLTFDTGSHVASLWTPDGDRIVYASNASGAYNLHWKRADGSDTAERLAESPHAQMPGSWSPDGELLVFTQTDPATGSDIWVLSVRDRAQPRPVVRSKFNEHGPALSPDGRWLAYCSNESGREEIYVQPFPGSGEKRQVSLEGGREPVWSREGDALFYRVANRFMRLPVTTSPSFSFGKPVVAAEGDYVPSAMGGVPSFDVAPQSQQILVVQENRAAAPSTIHVVLNWHVELNARVPSRQGLRGPR
jgi:eukaryotic-like serine/threonine-protein kinase